jgi:hypothetical protein
MLLRLANPAKSRNLSRTSSPPPTRRKRRAQNKIVVFKLKFYFGNILFGCTACTGVKNASLCAIRHAERTPAWSTEPSTATFFFFFCTPLFPRRVVSSRQTPVSLQCRFVTFWPHAWTIEIRNIISVNTGCRRLMDLARPPLSMPNDAQSWKARCAIEAIEASENQYVRTCMLLRLRALPTTTMTTTGTTTRLLSPSLRASPPRVAAVSVWWLVLMTTTTMTTSTSTTPTCARLGRYECG